MLAELLDLIWPRACAVCGAVVDRPGRHLCSDCLMRLPVLPADGLCRTCGRAAEGLDGEYRCDECRAHPPHFDRAASVFRFEGEARELVNRFKFREALFLRDDFVDFLEATVRVRFRLADIGCVVPMPSTLSHRWLRGYGQCAILARALARRLERPCLSLLRRTGSPRRQAGLSETERRTNVLGTFAVRRRLGAAARAALAPSAPAVLLVDDILTTGSTLSEAARTLRAAGAGRVFAVTLARSLRL